MKRFLVISIVLLGSMSMMAQHINFLGKPLGCNIATFKQRMIERGFKSNGEVEPTVYSFDGIFGGDEVLVAAYLSQKTRIVYQVGVFYNDYRSFSYDDDSKSTQKNKFNRLAESFVKKYGEPTINHDEFIDWEQEYGNIIINIGGNKDDLHRNLTVWYQDKESKEKNNEENESDY